MIRDNPQQQQDLESLGSLSLPGPVQNVKNLNTKALSHKKDYLITNILCLRVFVFDLYIETF